MSEEKYPFSIEPLGTTTLCIRHNREPIGFVSLLHYKETNQGEIVGLYIDPSFRRKGFAKRLIYGILDAARKEGLEEVKMTIAQDNEGANSFIEGTKFGFQKYNNWVLRL